MSNKISKRRIKERLTSGFLFASGIPSVVAVLVMVVLIVVAVIYSNSLENYGFAQGDVGKALKYFAESRSALRAAMDLMTKVLLTTRWSAMIIIRRYSSRVLPSWSSIW